MDAISINSVSVGNACINLTKEHMKIEEKSIREILRDYINNEHCLRMKRFIQHGTVTTYAHCINVVNIAVKINKLFGEKANTHDLVVGAFLHDFYLYDWHKQDGRDYKGLHGLKHPEIARLNAEKVFNINDNVKHIIETHMWPLTITKIPKSREAVIVTLSDKYISLLETFKLVK